MLLKRRGLKSRSRHHSWRIRRRATVTRTPPPSWGRKQQERVFIGEVLVYQTTLPPPALVRLSGPRNARVAVSPTANPKAHTTPCEKEWQNKSVFKAKSFFCSNRQTYGVSGSSWFFGTNELIWKSACSFHAGVNRVHCLYTLPLFSDDFFLMGKKSTFSRAAT